jgi:hypothetical protein
MICRIHDGQLFFSPGFCAGHRVQGLSMGKIVEAKGGVSSHGADESRGYLEIFNIFTTSCKILK